MFGHAIAMPVVVQTREYDEKFYRDMGDMITSKHIDRHEKICRCLRVL